MLKGESFPEYTNSFFPKGYQKNNKKLRKIFQQLKRLK